MEEMANNGGHPPCPGCFGPMAYLLEKQGSHIPQFFKFCPMLEMPFHLSCQSHSRL